MLCDICNKKEATVHYTEIVHNQMVKMDLCEECAKAKGIGVQSPFSISDLLSGLAEVVSEDHKSHDPVCECCGLSFSSFRKRGRFGCSECYETFKEPLESLLKSIHKNTQHKGKKLGGGVSMKQKKSKESPNGQDVVSLEDKLAEARERLRKLVDSEEYEKAAVLRDEIRDIETQIKNNG